MLVADVDQNKQMLQAEETPYDMVGPVLDILIILQHLGFLLLQ